jgi:hypothetical protein
MLLRILFGIALGASGVAMWLYTPWWVWAAGLVLGGLGLLTFGSLKSFVCLGGAAFLFLFSYAIQPDAISLFEFIER